MRISGLSLGLMMFLAAANVRAEFGAPPPDAEALAAGTKGPADAPTIVKPKNDSTNVTLSAGGLLTSGNSRTIALTINGALDVRRGQNGFGASVLSNYGEAAPTPDVDMVTSAENVQGRLRYDRYFGDRMSAFLITTGRYDKFQGLAFRLNLDPGFKFIVFKSPRSAAWAEAGYDFQYDLRTEAGRVQLDADGMPTGGPKLDPTRTDHSARFFVGLRHAFTQDITFSTGFEYLQSFIKTDLGDRNSRFNLNAVLAAKLFKGFSIGVGFNAAYDRLPIPGRQQLDTTTTLSLIYGWSDAAPKKEEKPKCPVCPEVKPVPATPPPADGTTPAPSDPAAPPAKPLPSDAAPTGTPPVTPGPMPPATVPPSFPPPPVPPAPTDGTSVTPKP